MNRIRAWLLPLLLTPLPAAAQEAAFDAARSAMSAGNFAEAYCLWKPLAEGGHAAAQYHLGWLYANGNGLQVNPERAVEWWRRAADAGHGDAQFALGLAATTGDGMPRDLKAAASWFVTAARRGHEDARDMLLRLAAEPEVALLSEQPDLLAEPWFGWHARLDGEGVNVRAGPGTEHRVLGQLGRQDRVRVVAQSGDWVRVVTSAALGDGAAAWIHADLVRPAAE